jgi:signal transduction histidine kinase
MRERLSKFSGLFQLKSTPAGGTVIRFALPLSQLSHQGNP